VAKRYYLSKVITVDGPFGPERRAKVLTQSGVRAGVQLLHPSGAWALVILDATNHVSLIADLDNRDLPDLSLDIKWNAMGSVAQRRLEHTLAHFGIPTSVFTEPTLVDAYRDVIDRIGQLAEPTFTTNNFDVS
jgi:hypothetical protein